MNKSIAYYTNNFLNKLTALKFNTAQDIIFNSRHEGHSVLLVNIKYVKRVWGYSKKENFSSSNKFNVRNRIFNNFTSFKWFTIWQPVIYMG